MVVKKWTFWPKIPLFGVLLEIFRGLLEKSSRVTKSGFNGWGWLGSVFLHVFGLIRSYVTRVRSCRRGALAPSWFSCKSGFEFEKLLKMNGC